MKTLTRAETPPSRFADAGISFGRTAETIVRSHPMLRRLPGLRSRTAAASLSAGDASTSVFFASVSAVQRTFGQRVSLDAVEIACGETYRRPADRERYFAARILLRHALSKAVDGKVAPGDWKYRDGSHGKPMMAAGLPPLQFNVSHSGDCVAVAVSRKDPVGIDIECAAPAADSGIVYEVLSEGERSRMRNIPPSRQWDEFVRLWTAKEATAKALGLGLSLNFATIDVQLDPLRVRLLYPPAGPSTDFDVASTTLTKNGKPYVLTTARLIGKRSAN